MQSTSIVNKHVNDSIEYTNELETIVLNIFKAANTPLTTNEMLNLFYLYVNKQKDESTRTKIQLAAKNNGLKAARTSLTHKGLLEETQDKKLCSISQRLVNSFYYTGVELSEKQQILNEIQRRIDDITRCNKKIAKLREKLGGLYE